jgi:virginiamycin B lyase
MTEISIPTPNSNPFQIALGPDGALWFTEVSGNNIGRIATDGSITEFAIPTAGNPGGITAGLDGALWFTEIGGNKIGRITTGGTISEFAIPTPGSFTHTIVAGPDGALWFAEVGGNKIGRITVGGVFTEFALPNSGSEPFNITVGPDGALWFTEINSDKIGRITTTGTITEFAVPTLASLPAFITAGPDGALWFTEASGSKIGRITTSGNISEFVLPTGSQPQGIAAGPDGALWFTEAGSDQIGRITTSGDIAQTPIPTANADPFGIAFGSNADLWFTEFSGNKIGEEATPLSGFLGVFDTTINTAMTAIGDPYDGPVAGLEHQYINITSDNINITATSPNWFIHSEGGEDALTVNSGTNVLDGGAGSNFLTDTTAGNGTDTFFVDDRGATADIWSTVVNFHAGDSATVWGVTPQDFALNFVDGQGAGGFTGLTLHATANGQPTTSLTLAGYAQADMHNGRVSVQFGTDPASGSSFMFLHANS